MNPSLINSFCYTFGWFWCVILGIQGHSILATIGAVFLIIFQLYYTKNKNISLYIQDFFLVIFSIPLGTLLEIFFIQTNTLNYTNTIIAGFPPIWIVLLYPLFSLLLNHSLKIIKKHYLAPFLLGFFCAPLSYIAGISLGGLIFPYPLIQTWIIIGICWGLFLSLLIKISNIVEKATSETLEDRNSKNSLEMLYDGDCPLCKREICILQKKENQNTIKFIDISSDEFMPSKHHNIDYETAMKKIHVTDDKGNILVGIQAFATIYARSNLLITSTFLRIPFITTFLNPLYTLFANKRLWLTGRNVHK